jgi:hypothetical protein
MRTPVDSAQRTARIAGVWFVLTFVFSIPALLLYDPMLGPAFCAGFGNGLLLGYLMYRSGLVPGPMALIGLIGGPIAFATATATAVLFGAYEQTSAVNFLVTLPEIVGEASLGIWLVVKGLRPSPIISGMGTHAMP